ncbi:MAG: PEP-CTERM sorting domain-containing protein [Pikeienuella sp.]
MVSDSCRFSLKFEEIPVSIRNYLFAAACVLAPSLSMASTVQPEFANGPRLVLEAAEETRTFRGDLTGLGLSTLKSVKITDRNTLGGFSGIYAGFELDAIFLDRDGDLSTTDDRIFADKYLYRAGDVRLADTDKKPIASTGGPLSGASSATEVDEDYVRLDLIDGVYFGKGGLSLGDGGSLMAVFDKDVEIGKSMRLVVAEVGHTYTNINGMVSASDVLQPIPVPATAPLLLGALGLFGFIRRRRGA